MEVNSATVQSPQTAQTSPMVNARIQEKQAAQQALQAAQAPVAMEQDQVQISSKQQEKKEGPVQKFKNFISGIKKAYISITGYTKGLVDGTIKAITYGGLAYGGLKLIDLGRTVLQKGAKGAPNRLLIGVAGLLGAAELGLTLFKTSLDVNEKKAQVDHRWKKEPHS